MSARPGGDAARIAIAASAAALDRFSGHESPKVIPRRDRVTGGALAPPWTASTGHFRGIYRIETIRATLIAAADCVSVVVIVIGAGEQVGRPTARGGCQVLGISDDRMDR